MTLAEILGLFFLSGAAWLLWSSLKAREAANAEMRTACRAEGLLFLDDTVALKSVWPVRDEEGRATLRWVYDFEYSDTGHNRRKGTVTVTGGTVSAFHLGSRLDPGQERLH